MLIVYHTKMSTFLDRLKLAMKKSGKTKTDLWRACEISSGAVSQWFSKPSTQLRGKNLLRVAQELGVNPEWLATGEGDMELTGNDNKAAANTVEVEKLLSLMEKMDPAMQESWIKIGEILSSTPSGRRIKNTSHNPMQQLDGNTYDHGPDLGNTYDSPKEDEQSQKRSKKK